MSFRCPKSRHSNMANLESNHFSKPGILATSTVEPRVGSPGALDVRRCAVEVLQCAPESHPCAGDVHQCAVMCSKNEDARQAPTCPQHFVGSLCLPSIASAAEGHPLCRSPIAQPNRHHSITPSPLSPRMLRRGIQCYGAMLRRGPQ